MSACGTPIQELSGLAEEKAIPLNMMLELTYRCNERCIHCYLPETQGLREPRVKDELSAGEWSRVMEEMAEAGTFYLILTGGEVLLKEEFDKILRRARELTFAVEIFTNATLLTPAIADFWADQGVSSVAVSVYSPKAVWHDRVTKLKGSFGSTMRGVKLLTERDIRVELKTPLMKLNLKSYQSLVALASEMGVGYKFDPMMTLRNDGSDVPVRLGLDKEQMKEVYSDPRLIPADDILQAGPLDPDSSTCSAGRTSGSIGPYGDVVPCIQWAVSGGNVKEKPFKDIWRDGAIFERARTVLGKDVKPCPACGEVHFIHCLGLSELEKGDALVPDSGSCRITTAMKEIQDAAKEKV